MAIYKMSVTLKAGTQPSNTTTQEVNLPDSISSKIGNSSNKQEMFPYIENALPKMIAGVDWKKNGRKVVDFSNVTKV